MPYVAGQTVEQRVRAEGPLSCAVTQRMVTEVASGLDALHAHGLVHRDVKASNIIFAADGSAALADFGLAKGTGYSDLTRPGQVVGTVDYLAPELIRGEAATPASDLYALGCVAFECLCGQTPFGGRSDLPQAYGRAVCQALRKDPGRRPAKAAAYVRALAAAVEAEVEAGPPAGAYPPTVTSQPPAPFVAPSAARAPRGQVASRLWLPAAATFAIVIGTAIALLVYFAAR
jgi:serine/threonine-protein kinase